MCCGAIMNSGISTLVMGGRPGSDTRWGDYVVERLIEMSNWDDRLEVVTGILTQECMNIREA